MSIRYISTFFISVLSFLSVLMLTPCQQSHFSHVYSFSRPCGGQILVSVFIFSICLCSTMLAPVPNGTLWLQTSPSLGLPLVEWRPHYLVPGVWCGRGVSATRFPTHTLPQNGNFDEKDEKNDDKRSTAVWILLPRGTRGRSLLSPKHPLL